MIQVKIKNLSNIQTHGAVFETQELADAWIAAQKAKGINCAWGRPAWNEQVLVLDEFENPILDGEGNEQYTEVQHDDQFTIETSDITEQYQLNDARNSLKAARNFGVGLVDDFAIENIILNITDEESDLVLSVMLPAFDSKITETTPHSSNKFEQRGVVPPAGVEPAYQD